LIKSPLSNFPTLRFSSKHLHEQLRDWQSLAVLAQLAKQTLDKRKKLNVAEVHGKQTQTSPAGQLLIGWKYSLNMLFLILPNPRIFAHVAFYLLGCVICKGNFVVKHYSITLYLLRRGFFYTKSLNSGENKIVGIEILHASQKMNIKTILSYELELDNKLIQKTA